MEKFTRHYKLIKYSFHVATILCACIIVLVLPGINQKSQAKGGLISVYLNGDLVGTVSETSEIDTSLIKARRRLARTNRNGLVLATSNIVLRESNDIFGRVDDEATLTENIYKNLLNNTIKTKESAYQVKIGTETINLKTYDDVLNLLREAKDLYDKEGEYEVNLELDPERELYVLATDISKKSDDVNVSDEKEVFPTSGITKKLEQFYKDAQNLEIDSFKAGVKNIDFAESVEVIQSYVDSDMILDLDTAIDYVTKEEEQNAKYEVKIGDSLGLIAQKNGITVKDLISLNSQTLTSEKSMIQPGDILNIVSPEPLLSVLRTEEEWFEETYEAQTQYVDNDDWFVTESRVLVEPVSGFHKGYKDSIYKNDQLISSMIVFEEIVNEPVAKVVERGTKQPPTYIRPISGGRQSSGFGRRKAPKKGASTYHKGIDYAIPTGTAVWASCGGTVTRAGWGSGYGYCVYIKHPDGKETRYGHLSKVLCKVGQTVKQGEKIALSGNTGISTGPHLHFEILVNGVQVNPLNYMN